MPTPKIRDNTTPISDFFAALIIMILFDVLLGMLARICAIVIKKASTLRRAILWFCVLVVILISQVTETYRQFSGNLLPLAKLEITFILCD